MLELMRKLTGCVAPSGFEGEIREIISGLAAPYADEIAADRLGNLIVHKKGPGKKVMLAAHMDEIGFIVTHIDEKGFLRVAPIGGIYPHRSSGAFVRFGGGRPGVLFPQSDVEAKDLKVKDLFVDIGASDRAEAEKLVAVGAVCVMNGTVEALAGARLAGKAMDDRAGCAVLLEALKLCREPKNDLYFVFTVQEEVGLRGAGAAAFAIAPDLAIAVDGTGTGDTPGDKPMEVSVGKGPAIKLKDSSLICSREVVELLTETAQRENIPFQYEILLAGGTDTAVIQTSRAGVPSGCVSIPMRYVHSAVETVDATDMENAARLLAAAVG